MSLSGCIIVKDEERLLGGCLESIRRFADEIIVIDNGSTDGSRAVAQTFGAKILSYEPQTFDAASARNLYMDVASQSWILRIDADCRMTPEGGSEIRRAIETAPSEVLGMTLPVFDYYGDGKWSSVRMGHLFRNLSKIRYQSNLHTTITFAVHTLGGKWQPIFAPMHHLDILLQGRTALKRSRYMSQLISELEANPSDFRLYYFLGHEYLAAGRFADAEKQYRIALRRGPMHAGRARLHLAQLYLLQGDLPAAANAAKQVKGSLSMGIEEQAAMVLAEIAVRQARWDDALHICLQVYARDPKSPHICVNIAALLEGSDAEQAISYLDRAIALNPYLMKPIIYRSGERPNLFHFQTSFLSNTGTIFEHMEHCWNKRGNHGVAHAWRRAGEYVQEVVDHGDENALQTPISIERIR